MALSALECVLGPADDARVRGQWTALAAAGVPSRGDHRGASNAPHLTLVTAASIPTDLRDRVAQRIGGMLPLTMRLGPLALLGQGRWVLAHLVLPPSGLVDDVLSWQNELAGPQQPWVPHLSVSGRLRADQVGPALLALADDEADDDTASGPAGEPVAGSVTLVGLRHWDAATGRTALVAGDQGEVR